MIIINFLLCEICYSYYSHTSEIHYTGIETHGDGPLEPQSPPPPTTVHLVTTAEVRARKIGGGRGTGGVRGKGKRLGF